MVVPDREPPDAVERDLLEAFGFRDARHQWIDLLREAEHPLGLGRIGEYELLEEVGRGGQGVVYRARQAGTQRIIALKRLLAGSLAGASANERFRREVEVAAALDHQSVITVFGFELVDGQPLLAMEWVDGVPLDEWARDQDSTSTVVDLFLELCAGVRHAHQRGILHRDLKPSNILVGRDGRPRILDFGLAKRTHGDDRLTRSAQFLGTPRYAAPEVQRDSSSYDARADVYALGVLLVEALTGELPPPVPRPDGAGTRDVEDAELRRPWQALGSELEAVLLTAIATDPERRYSSVDALMEDLRRWRQGEGVLAHPPTLPYRLRVLARQHRLAIGLAAGAVVLLAVFGAHTSWQARTLARERDAVEAERRRAEEHHEESRAILGLLFDVVLPSFGPEAEGPTAAFEAAATRIDETARDRPLARATMHVACGDVFLTLGRYTPAASHFERALEIRRAVLGDDAPDVARCRRRLAKVIGLRGDLARAEAEFARAEVVLRRQTDDAADDLIEVLTDRANVLIALGRPDVAGPMLSETLGLCTRRGPADGLHAAAVRVVQASLRLEQQRPADAVADLRHALEVQERRRGADSLTAIRTGVLLGFALATAGEHASGEARLRRARTALEERLADSHPWVMDARTRHAEVLLALGRGEEAEDLARRAVAVARVEYGASSPLAPHLNTLGEALVRRGSVDEGLAQLEESCRITRAGLGDGHPRLAAALTKLSSARLAAGDVPGARSAVDEALAIGRAVYGEASVVVAYDTCALARILAEQGDYIAYAAHYEKAYETFRARLGREHPDTLQAYNEIANGLGYAGRWEEAVERFRTSLALRRTSLPAGDPKIGETLLSLGSLLRELERHDEAMPFLVEASEIFDRTLDASDPRRGWAREALMAQER